MAVSKAFRTAFNAESVRQTHRPRFLFQIEELRPTHSVYDTSAHWSPPTMAAGQYLVPGTSQVYRWNANDTASVTPATLPPGATVYRQATMYHCAGRFWTVPYSALAQNVHDEFPCWRGLTFRHEPNSVSSVGCAYADSRLATQRHNQTWLRQLLPEGYWPHYDNQQPGGLQGDLAIILALAAFSAPPQYIAQALDTSFKVGRWQQHNYGSGSEWGYSFGLLSGR